MLSVYDTLGYDARGRTGSSLQIVVAYKDLKLRMTGARETRDEKHKIRRLKAKIKMHHEGQIVPYAIFCTIQR